MGAIAEEMEKSRKKYQVRLLPSEWEALTKAAKKVGLPVSTWIRMTCLREAEEGLKHGQEAG